MRLRPNPQYAVEEFTYVPDPADNNGINYDQEDNEINSFGNNNIQVPPVNITKAPVFIENFENLRNITFRLTEDNRRNKRKEEAKQSKLEFKVTSNQVNFKKGLASETNSSLVSEISSRLQCSELAETGFCSVDPGLYPSSLVARLMEECGTEALVRSWDALVPLDLDSLGDNTRSVISSQKDRDRPWSWTVSAYSKSQVCQSDLAFTQPSYARDTRGKFLLLTPLMLSSLLPQVGKWLLSRPGEFTSPCQWTRVSVPGPRVPAWPRARPPRRDPSVSRDSLTSICWPSPSPAPPATAPSSPPSSSPRAVSATRRLSRLKISLGKN